MPSLVKPDERFPHGPDWLFDVTKISWVSGLICSIISLVKKERLKYFKIFGIVINFLIFTILMLIQIILLLRV